MRSDLILSPTTTTAVGLVENSESDWSENDVRDIYYTTYPRETERCVVGAIEANDQLTICPNVVLYSDLDVNVWAAPAAYIDG